MVFGDDSVVVENYLLQTNQINLAASIIEPESEEVLPGLILCHGIPGGEYNPEDHGYEEFAKKFARAGYRVLIFNFRGCGESEGNIDMWGWRDDFNDMVSFFSTYIENDDLPIYVIGFSGGAAIAVCETAENERVDGLAICACPKDFIFFMTEVDPEYFIGNWRRIGIIRDPDYPWNKNAWMDGFITLRPELHIERISKRPLLILHGSDDETIPMEHAEILFQKALPPKEIEIISGAGHKLRENEETYNILIRWLKSLPPHRVIL